MTAEEEDRAMKDALSAIGESSDPAKVGAAYLNLASAYERRHEFIKAKETYQKFIEKFPSSGDVQKAQESVYNVNVKMLFDSSPADYSTIYMVKKGDNLTKIAKRFNTTVDLLAKANGIKADKVRVGQKIKIPTLKLSIVIDKSQNILTLKNEEEVFKTYRVSTGKDGSTPVGVFKVTDKIVDPPWYPSGQKPIPPGDPRNVLGSRWLGISKPSYGIHGTTDPGSIGKSVTEGCVRLKNSDVEELYCLVPEGTEVVITE